jgi:methylated-DNA-[protein]-cysteine S-methyltransferase
MAMSATLTDRGALRIAVLESPFGPVHVAVTGDAVVAVEMRTTLDVFTEGLRRRRRAPGAPSRVGDAGDAGVLLDRLAAALREYFGGRPVLDVPVALDGLSDWDRRVLEQVRRIPFGETSSYGGVATAIGARGAARAVGGAVGRNPIGLVIPCHRVIAGDGSLGGYGRSWSADGADMLELKRSLLAHEGVSIGR